VDFRDAASERCPLLHLREHVCEEQHLAVARSSDERVFDIARVLDHKPRIFDAVLTAQTFEVALPALAVRRIRKDEVEFSRGERVIGQSRVLGTADDVVSRIAFALYKQIGFTDGVRLRVDLLRSRSVNFDVL
jgi:hypothetical protein